MLFRKHSLSLGRNDIVPLKEAYKWITHPLFSEELGVPIDGKVLGHQCCFHSLASLVLLYSLAEFWVAKRIFSLNNSERISKL
jgi:hypothetical protein